MNNIHTNTKQGGKGKYSIAKEEQCGSKHQVFSCKDHKQQCNYCDKKLSWRQCFDVHAK